MRLLPYRTFTIETPLMPVEVEARLRAGIEPERWLRTSRDHAPFEGVLEGTRFEMRRIIHYRNSFRPRIEGTFEPAVGGTRLTGTMAVHAAVTAFMAVWFGGVALAVAVSLRAFSGAGRLEVPAAIPLLMLAFGIVLVVAGFTFEARKALSELCRLVEASRGAWT